MDPKKMKNLVAARGHEVARIHFPTVLAGISAAFALSVPCVIPLYAAPPSDAEQHFLELLNRARANPSAEVILHESGDWEGAPDLNEGLAPETISTEPKPPLAFDPRLIDAALLNSVRENASVLGIAGLNGNHRLLPEGFTIDRTRLPSTTLERVRGENFDPANGAVLEEHFEFHRITSDRPAGFSGFSYGRDVEFLHRLIFIDKSSADRERRVRIMNPDATVIGLSFRTAGGRRAPGDGLSEFPFVTTHTFVSDPKWISVTGVVFHDWNGNRFYDPGERAGILGLRITTASGVEVSRGRTFPSGGYTIPFFGKAPGNYILHVSEKGGATASQAFVWTNQSNVKVDIIDPPFTEDLDLDGSFRIDGSARISGERVEGLGEFGPVKFRRMARSSRPIVLEAKFLNRGFSKVNAVAGFNTFSGRRYDFEMSGFIEIRNRKSSTRPTVRFAKSAIVQTNEEIRMTIKIEPRTRGKGGNVRSGMALYAYVREESGYFGGKPNSDTVEMKLRNGRQR